MGITIEQRGGSPVAAFFILLLLAAGLAFGLAMVVQSGQLTKHAETAHQGQAWDATLIKNYMDNGQCTPTVYTCPNAVPPFRVRWCAMNGKKAIGLIESDDQYEDVITGFMGNIKYWENRCGP
jgi:hypothetical protein